MDDLLIAPAPEASFGLGTALVYAIIGMAVLFAVLCLLFVIISLFGRLFSLKKQAAPAPAAPAPAPVTAEAPAPAKPKLIDVDDQTAALLIAIVADASGIAPERLCVDSIRLIEE